MSEADLLTISTIIESLMDYSRQLIMDEEIDGQDYGSAAVIDGIGFMKHLKENGDTLAARVEALTALIEGLECARPVTSNNNLEDSKKNIGVWEYACIDYARLTGHKREWCSVCKAKAALADGGDKS